MSTAFDFIWSHCNECGQETKHDIVQSANRSRTYDNDLHPVKVGSVWKVLQCRGCEEMALQRLDWCSEDDPQVGPDPATYFPPRVSRRRPVWAERLDVPSAYLGLLDETYTALHANSRRLAAMGARALIDAFITRQVGDQGTFAAGLDMLVSDGFMTQQNREIVDAAVNAGNASAHRGHKPSAPDLSVVIDIVENLIQNELLKEPVQSLKANTPVRQKPVKNNKKSKAKDTQ